MKNKDLYQPDTDFPFRIGRPAGGALKHAGYFRLKQLSKLTEAELLQIHGVGPKAVGILRELLKAKGMSFATATKPRVRKEAPAVDEFMRKLNHPFKVEVETIRKIIKGVNRDIAEEIKWNAPSFSFNGEYLVTFNLRETKRVHLVFHNPLIAKVESKLLEGNYKDRRMMYFADMKDVKVKEAELEKILKQLIKLNWWMP